MIILDQIMQFLLEKGYYITKDYGIAIILVTIIIRSILLPVDILQKKNEKKTRIMSERAEKIKREFQHNPQKMEAELQELLEEIKAAEGKDVMTIAAYLHLRFEEIHPFADGNGRVGRTLLNYYLMTHGFPPLIFFSEDKKTYYLSLAVYDKTGEIKGFIEFLKEQMVKTWEKKKRVSVN